jgi:hypothetical protein
MAFPISFPQHCVFTAYNFHFSIWSKPTASFQTTTFQLPQGFPKDLLPPKHFLIAFCGIGVSSILTLRPTHCSFFRRKKVDVPHHHTIRNLLFTPNSPQALGLPKLEY